NPITESTVSKIESKFRETGDVKDLPKSGRPKFTQEKKIDIVSSMEENPQSTSTLVTSENEVSQTTVLPILGKKTIIPTNFSLCPLLRGTGHDEHIVRGGIRLFYGRLRSPTGISVFPGPAPWC
ncbi:hypothetical protein NQ318_018336, partial [Aromia moschata]